MGFGVLMNELIRQLEPMLEDEELIESLTVLPPVKAVFSSKSERLMSLMDIYKIYIPSQTTVDVYNRIYLSVVGSLEKKNTMEETKLLDDNYRCIKGLTRCGVVGGLDSFRLTGNPGVGKTSMVQRCIEVITKNKNIRTQKPYREIIPILEVETVSDCSIKNLLYSILIKVDERLGTKFYKSNKSQHTTTDVLLAAVSNVLSNHVGLLCIDEIERVVDNKKGVTLLNYLTQLINQSNICICFIGTESSNQFFEMKEYLARRTIGVSVKGMKYDKSFYDFLTVLFRYQYTIEKVELSSGMVRWFYDHTNGLPSMLVSLFVETQKRIIINGRTKLTIEELEETYKTVFSTMSTFIDVGRVRENKPTHIESYENEVASQIVVDNVFNKVSKVAYRDVEKALQLLRNYVVVEFI